ncbi:MAG TPA: VOC family protein [Kofleriaceae bacterium]|nr:VOC family protein [Kofleriaceae bacterium]
MSKETAGNDAAPTLGYVLLYVPDVAKAVAFWEKAFGLALRFAHESGTYSEMETGATALGFVDENMARENGGAFRLNRPDGEPAGIEVALCIKDVPALFARATAAGAKPVKAPTTKPWGQTVAYVRDPDGVLVELCTPMG